MVVANVPYNNVYIIFPSALDVVFMGKNVKLYTWFFVKAY